MSLYIRKLILHVILFSAKQVVGYYAYSRRFKLFFRKIIRIQEVIHHRKEKSGIYTLHYAYLADRPVRQSQRYAEPL